MSVPPLTHRSPLRGPSSSSSLLSTVLPRKLGTSVWQNRCWWERQSFSSVWSILMSRWRLPSRPTIPMPSAASQETWSTMLLLSSQMTAVWGAAWMSMMRLDTTLYWELSHWLLKGSLCHEEHKAHPHTHQKETIHTGSVFTKCMETAPIIHGTGQVKPLSFRRTLSSQSISRSTFQSQQMLLPVLLDTVTPIYYMLSRVTVAIQPRDEHRDSLHLKRCITWPLEIMCQPWF